MINKSPAILEAIEILFPGTGRKIATGECPSCGLPIGDFRDEISLKEYGISGLCQTCQDEIFGEDVLDFNR